MPDGGYVILQDMAGILKAIAHKELSFDEFELDGFAKLYIPMLYSGVITKARVRKEDGVGLKITEQTRRRLINYSKELVLPNKELHLQRFIIEPNAQVAPEFIPKNNFSDFITTQYVQQRPTWYSGAMAEVMQIVGGFGKQNLKELPENAMERAQFKIPDKYIEKIAEELEGIRLPAYSGVPPLDGAFQYDYKFYSTNGVVFDTANKPWLVRIGPGGVYAMPLPIIPATATSAFREYIEEVGDDELLKNMDFSFDNPKPIRAAKYFLSIISRPTNSLILDYFAGSGTTAHAVINLNREDGGKRKYILVEQGEYFDTVLKPRVQKVVYAENWKDGKPVPCGKPSENRTEANPFNGVSQIVKVLKLESYEDTLNNLVLQRKGQVDFLSDEVKQDYLLHYMLEADSRDSLLSSDDFRQPFDYQLNISTGSAGAFAAQTIDLVETFNYLIGLRVCTVDDQAAARGFVFVEGSLPNNEKCLVLWRDCERWGYEQLPELLDDVEAPELTSQEGGIK